MPNLPENPLREELSSQSKIAAQITEELSDNDLLILNELIKNPLQSATSIASIIGLHHWTVCVRMKRPQFRKAKEYIEGDLRDKIIELQEYSLKRLGRIVRNSKNDGHAIEASKIALVGLGRNLQDTQELSTQLGFGALPANAALPQNNGGDPCQEVIDASYEEFESHGAANQDADNITPNDGR